MFTGFTEKATEFLWGIRLNNNRAWFLENKGVFQDEIQAPLKALADDVWSYLTEKTGLDLTYRISRIYKDARRVKTGEFYKDSLWFSLEKHHENWQETPVFFFEISPEGYMYGMGYYAATAATMKIFRDRLDVNPAEFERIAAALKSHKALQIFGEEYRRKKAEKIGLLADWYNRKTLAVIAEFKGHETIATPAFAKTLCLEFESLVPLYAFCQSLEGDV
ncbi:DUF2461 domain-containing protein [Oscillospiraceae bacterium WX1]